MKVMNTFAPIALVLESQAEASLIAALMGGLTSDVIKAFGVQDVLETYCSLKQYIYENTPTVSTILEK